MVDIMSRLDEVELKTASSLSAMDGDAGASPVLAAVVREFDAEAKKATSTSSATALKTEV